LDEEGNSCFRLHMYLSLKFGRTTDGALEGEHQVERKDDKGNNYFTYLLRSDEKSFMEEKNNNSL